MKTQEAISHFGSVRKLAEALGLSVQAIYAWGENVPALRAYELKDLMSSTSQQQQKAA